MGDDADILALGFEDRPLLDVQFEESVHFARADLLVALPADALQLVAELLALGVGAIVGPVEIVDAGEDARSQHGRGKAGALLIGPVGDDDGVLRLDVEIVERADDFQPAEHAQDAVIAPARRLRVEVAADIDRQRPRVGARAHGEHGAHLVDAHRQPRRLAPVPEQVAAFAVFVGQGLAVVAARDARADLGHFLYESHSRSPLIFRFSPGAGMLSSIQVGLRLGIQVGHSGWANQLLLGKVKTAPYLMPAGQRVVTVLSRV